MDYLTEIKPFEDLGKDDVWIAELLSGLTSSNIKAVDLFDLFREQGLWANTPNGYSGDLQDAWGDPANATPALTLKVMGALWSIVFDGVAEQVWTTIEYRPNNTLIPKGTQFARNLNLTLDRLKSNGDLTQAQIDDLYELAGGLKYPGTIEQNVIDARVAWQAAEVERIAANRLINAKALFSERMTAGGDAAAVWTQAWIDAEVPQ